MKLKKVFLIIVVLLCLSGCVNIKELKYDDIINMFSNKEKTANVYNKGYQYYLPKGLSRIQSGSNYSIIGSENITYYLYSDLVSYINKNEITYEINNSLVYSKKIINGKKTGYVEIKLWENNQYLIEIMYNYAKIEVMVEEKLIKEALINSINILNSMKYNDDVINSLLNDDKLNYTEESFELFENDKNNSNILDYVDSDDDSEQQDEIKDTDFIN